MNRDVKQFDISNIIPFPCQYTANVTRANGNSWIDADIETPQSDVLVLCVDCDNNYHIGYYSSNKEGEETDSVDYWELIQLIFNHRNELKDLEQDTEEDICIKYWLQLPKCPLV